MEKSVLPTNKNIQAELKAVIEIPITIATTAD